MTESNETAAPAAHADENHLIAERRAKLAAAPGWGDYLEAATPFLLKMENRILVPTAFSPMK